MMSTASDVVVSSDDKSAFKWPPQASPWLSKTSPWLMLPPAFEPGRKVVYQFYSLGENKVIGLKKINEDEDLDGEMKTNKEDIWAPDDDCKIVGSSHGWLALYNERNGDLFLSNPLYRRHVTLPSIHTLDKYIRQINVIILSSSPDDDDENCRAMIIYGLEERLAFCCPGRSTEWTPLGNGLCYESCVYSTTQKLFFCCSKVRNRLESWDLGDPFSPRMIPVDVNEDKYHVASRSEEEDDVRVTCHKYRFLVVVEPSGHLLHVRRFVYSVGPHGYYVEDNYYGPKLGVDDTTAHTTFGFDVHKYDTESGSFKYMDRSLDGLALFVGSNHGFALSADEFPELKPDSIYYTTPPHWQGCWGGHDVGIFDYRDETLSPCFYPVDVQSLQRTNPHMWFTPTPVVRFPFLVKNSDGSLSYASSCSFVPPTKVKDAS